MTPSPQAESTPGALFREAHVDVDGFRIRYLEAGQGPPLVHLHGAGGLRLSRAHDLLSRQFRVVAFEMPGFGQSPENVRTKTMGELAGTMGRAIDTLGLGAFNLMGTSFGGTVALWLTLQAPDRVPALILEGPAAIRPEGWKPVSGSPEEMARRIHAHPERFAHIPPLDPAIRDKQERLTGRLRRPNRDADLERRLTGLATPTLVLFGTLDGMIPSEMGRVYKTLMPNSHLILVYDAGHAVGADRPEAFTEVVTDFLERHEAFVISRAETVIHP